MEKANVVYFCKFLPSWSR